MINCRVFTEDDFPEIYLTMDEAFSDYIVKMEMDSDEYKRKFEFEGVRFKYSVGAFDDEKLVGVTMNAVGNWNDVPTVYDSGTGVIPTYRRKGISTKMFDFIVPRLKESGFKQYVLEVLTENEAARNLYESLDFKVTREFSVYRQTKTFKSAALGKHVEIFELENPDWDKLKTFWSAEPSWQNSIDCVKRAINEAPTTVVLGVYVEKKLVGYGVVSEVSGKLFQIAILNEYRSRGFGKALLCGLQKYTEKPLIITNVDTIAINVIGFLESCGFTKTISQYEMLKKL